MKQMFGVVALGLMLSVATPLMAQTAQPDAVAGATAVKEIVKSAAGTTAEAGKAADAALEAAKAGKEAVDEAAKLKTLAESEAPTVAALGTAADAAVTKAAAAAGKALSAAGAAATAATKISIDTAKGVAGQAVAASLAAANSAQTAADEAKAAAAKTKAAATVADAKKAATETATQATKAGNSAADAASQAALAAREAVTPSLPVTETQDQDVIAALGMRLTGGAIFFNGNGGGAGTTKQFSQATTYIAMEAQPRIWSFGGSPDTVSRRGYSRMYIDPFVNVRLTAIPVANAVDSNTGASKIGAPTASFQQSDKAAQIQLGGSATVNFAGRTIGSTSFHWGFGVVARQMYQSVTDSQRSVRVWNTEDDLFDATTVGLRLTLFERSVDSTEGAGRGWAPAAYVDGSWSHFQNFEQPRGLTVPASECLADKVACAASTSRPPKEAFAKDKKPRLYVEARVFLRHLYLGLDLNNGDGHDDVRFIGGLTMKLDDIFVRR